MAGGYYTARRRYGNGYSSSSRVMAPYKRPYKRKTTSTRPRMFRAGYDRVGGYYGRYNKPMVGRGYELKFFDSVVTVPTVLTAGSLTDSLNEITQGVQEDQRIGRKCVLKEVIMNYKVQLGKTDEVAAQVVGDSIRIIMYLDKQCNGATAIPLDILKTADFQGFRNLSNTSRFTVLCDKTHDLMYRTMTSESSGNISQGNVQIEKSITKKVNLPLEFSSTTGAITEIRSNNIGLLLISSLGIIGFISRIRVRFSDK